MSNKWRISVSTASNAAAVLCVQVLALVSLPPSQFGEFSLLYLASAFTQSVLLSAVCEAWVRSDRTGLDTPWKTYASVTVYFAMISAVVPVLIGIIVPSLLNLSWLAAIATVLSAYRLSARYYSLRMNEWSYVLRADVMAAIAAILATVLVVAFAPGEVEWVLLAWVITSAVSAIFSKPARFKPPYIVLKWVQERHSAITPLLRDSLVMDASAIGTPYVLAPVLGIAGFGVYRGVSNVASPVRLILNPLRPKLASIPHPQLIRSRTVLATLVVACLLGSAASGALLILGVLNWQLGTLASLAAFALPTGLFVAANMFGHFFYLVSRNHASGSAIGWARLAQTLLGVVLPVSGALLWDLGGAIWAYTVATSTSAIVWALAARRQRYVQPETTNA